MLREPTDYQTYKEIISDLMSPISAEGLDNDTLKRLYESKLVYLENLRIKCFVEMNSNPHSYFKHADYRHILSAISSTKDHLKKLVILVITGNLGRRKIS